jgi:hypothetical protein
MKKSILLLVFTLFSSLLAMAQAPKYALLEHFTNTRCGVCGGTNPSFYQSININSNPKLHHLSIHSSIPYSACVFYQANTQPQDARASFYSVPGTPRVSINGASTTGAGGISAATIDNNFCTDCSPIQVIVSEINNGFNRSLNVKVKSIGAPPSGNHRLLVALAEKTINYNAPNGESVHHNVFRQFLTTTAGDALSFAPQGGETNVNFVYNTNSNWVASEIYALAWVFNESTKEVVNSGTRFDSQIIPIELASWKGEVSNNKNHLEWTTLTERNTDFFDIERSQDGKLFEFVGRVKAANNSAKLLHYTFDDDKSLPNIAYYRLKTVDLDGQTQISNTLTLTRKGQSLKNLILYPTITTEKLHVGYFSDNGITKNEWRIINTFGKVVQQFSKSQNSQNTDGTSRENREGMQTETIDVSGLDSGLYFVQLIQNNETKTARFLKTK